ncbi:MAG: hypothetical protein J6T15_05110 [Bacilli bacterium]|nr:hypothetical protein [Bacilli bacterium]
MVFRGNPTQTAESSYNFDCYIENKTIKEGEKGRIIPLIFSPQSLSDTVTASFNQQSIPGGSAPVITYSSTGARTVSMELLIPIDYLPPGSLYSNTEEYLNAFRALVYPGYSEARVIAPNCYLHLTNIDLDGVCTQCGISYKPDQRFGIDGALGADVSLSFTEVLNTSLGSSGVAGKTTILKGTQALYSGSGNYSNSSSNQNQQSSGYFFKMNGPTYTEAHAKVVVHKNPNYYDLLVPNYNDPGVSYSSGDYNVVTFYFASKNRMNFTGWSIHQEGNVYKLVFAGETFATSDKVLYRNNINSVSRDKFFEEGGEVYIYYWYYIYIPYIRLTNNEFQYAKIRTIKCSCEGIY